MKMKKRFTMPGGRRITAFVLAICLLLGTKMFFASPAAFADGMGMSGDLGSSLGESGLGYSGEFIAVHTAEELYQISLRVNGGESFANKTIQIKEELFLQQLEKWEPLGTAEHPFSGRLDGEQNTIHGIETEDPDRATLFGTIKNALVKDLTLAVRCPDTLGELSSYLMVEMETSTIQNCHVILDTYAPFRMFGFSPYIADMLWYTDHQSDLTYEISSIEELIGLATLVNEGKQSFLGRTITFTADVDLSLIETWTPIGVPNRPFQGTFTGSGAGIAISGLRIRNPGLRAAGLFGYINDATISNISLSNASVSAGINVGALVGHMTNSAVSGCYSGGVVAGVSSVGGLIGFATHTSTTPSITESYATADVVGTDRVGGFVGEIDVSTRVDTCFATGIVSGVLDVGGFVGKTSNTTGFMPNSGLCSKVSHVASTGNVQGSGTVGGLVGTGDKARNFYTYPVNKPWSFIAAEYSYTSSRVDGYSAIGSILGGAGYTEFTYSSGQAVGGVYIGGVISSLVNVGVGNVGSAFDSLANWDPDHPLLPGVQSIFNRPDGSIPSQTPWFIDGAMQNTLPGFYTGDLVYDPATNALGHQRLPIGGNYPQLPEFKDSSLPVFQNFSKISTDALIALMPTELYFNDGYLAIKTSDSPATYSDIELPTAGGLVTWSIGGSGPSSALPDPTVPEGYNAISVDGNHLKMDYPLIRDHALVLWGHVDGVDGLILKKTIKIKSAAVRPVLSSLSPALHAEPGPDADFPGAERLSNVERSLYIEFPVPVSSASLPLTVSGMLELYDDGWLPIGTTFPLTYTLINDTVLKVEWPADTLGYDQKFKLDIPASLNVVNQSGNKVDLTYYLISTENNVAHLRFSPHVVNQSYTSPDQYAQTITMTQGDPGYNPSRGYLEGVLVENESVVVITDADVQFAVINSAHTAMTAPADPILDRTTFYKYPGTYTFTYQVADPEEPVKLSNVIVRTYEVIGDSEDLFEVDGVFGPTHLPAYQPKIILNSLDVCKILENNTVTGSNPLFVAALEKELGIRHKAIRVGASGGQETLTIQYDFSGLTGNIYEEGFIGVLFYQIADWPQTHPLYVQIEPALNLYEIATDYERYTASQDGFDGTNLLSIFNPRLERDGVLHGMNSSIEWSIVGSVDTSKLYEYQLLTIRADNVYGITGLGKTKQVMVSIVGEDEVPHQYDDRKKLDNDPLFWEKVEVAIKKAEPGKDVAVRLDRKHAAAPYSVFRTLSQQQNVTMRLEMENGFVLRINSDDLALDKIKSPAESFNIYIENIQNLDVNRDARNQAVQQFYTRGYENVPCAATLQVPLNEDMLHKNNRKLYTFDRDTLDYQFVMNIDASAVKDGVLTLELDQIEGEYVIR